MKDGFIKVAACTPEIQVADVDFNVDKIISQLEKCREEGVKVAVFPELCITGYTCQDLFFQNALLDKAMEGWNTRCTPAAKTLKSISPTKMWI